MANGEKRPARGGEAVPLSDLGSATGFLGFSLGYWASRSARLGRLLVATALALLLLNLVVNVGFNRWHRWFFDMIERKDPAALPLAAGAMVALILLGAGFAVAMVRCRMTLQLEWRVWVTETLMRKWAERGRTGSLAIAGENHGSPEFRMVEDVRLAIEPIVDLAIGFANSLILASTFVGILVAVGGSFTLDVLGIGITVPAYLAISAIAYAAILSASTYGMGQPLIRRVAEKTEAESQFLFELTRAVEGPRRDHAAAEESGVLGQSALAFRRVTDRSRQVIREYCRLTWLTNSNSFFAPVLPLLLAAPKYISGEFTLGEMMQVATAFTSVLGALNWLTDNYVRLAEWSASARRVDEMRLALLSRSDGAWQ